MTQTPIRPRLAIVDDDEADAFMVSKPLERAGADVTRLSGQLESVEQLVEQIEAERFDATLCDHRLSPGGTASFTGANAAARLFDRNLPNVLLTTYIDVDASTSIRPWRRKIPALLRRADARDPNIVLAAIEKCREEINGNFAADRVPRRTVVRLLASEELNGFLFVDVLIPAWRPFEAIRLSGDVLPQSVQDAVLDVGAKGQRVTAIVNTSAEDQADLFVDDVIEVHPSRLDASWDVP